MTFHSYDTSSVHRSLLRPAKKSFQSQEEQTEQRDELISAVDRSRARPSSIRNDVSLSVFKGAGKPERRWHPPSAARLQNILTLYMTSWYVFRSVRERANAIPSRQDHRTRTPLSDQPLGRDTNHGWIHQNAPDFYIFGMRPRFPVRVHVITVRHLRWTSFCPFDDNRVTVLADPKEKWV